MPFLFKEKSQFNKGVLIFKHSEYGVYKNMPEKIRRLVKDNYFVGVYFGFVMRLSESWGKNDVDFAVATDNVALGLSSDIPRISLNGFNFVDSPNEEFKETDIKKIYDFIFIGNSQTRKNLHRLTEGLKKADKIGLHPSVLIVSRVGSALEEKLNSYRINRHIQSLSDIARSKIRYIVFDSRQDQVPKDAIYLLMRQSKALICPSRSEGAARVVAEACLRRLNVISFSEMKGGTNNFLDSQYDIKFDDLNQLHLTMKNFMEHYDFYKQKPLLNSNIYLESESKLLFIRRISEITGIAYNDCFNTAKDLNMRNALSCHTNILPSKFTSKQTDETHTSVKMVMYLENLLNTRFDVINYAKAHLSDVFQFILGKIRKSINLIKLFL